MSITPSQYRKLREEAGLTQTGLANLMGVSLRTIAGRENGTAPISIEASYALKWMRHVFPPTPKAGAKK